MNPWGRNGVLAADTGNKDLDRGRGAACMHAAPGRPALPMREKPCSESRHRQHDLWPVENVKDFQLLTLGVDAIGIPDQSRSDLSAGAQRTACGGFEAPRPRPLASAPSPHPMRSLCA